jgi:hypothetical protein
MKSLWSGGIAMTPSLVWAKTVATKAFASIWIVESVSGDDFQHIHLVFSDGFSWLSMVVVDALVVSTTWGESNLEDWGC